MTFLRWSLLLLVLIMLGWRLSDLAGSFGLNQAAIASLSECGSKSVQTNALRPGASNTFSPSQAAWLQLLDARCTGNDYKAEVAMRAVLASSDARLDVVHAAANYDLTLARFAAATYPGRAEAHFWLGDAFAKQDDTDRAVEAYERGLALQDMDGNFWLTLGNLYEARGDSQAAARAYDQACRRGDRGSNGCSMAGETYLRLGEYQLAAERYESSIKQIGHISLSSERGLVAALMGLGRTKDAIPHLAILAANGSSEAQEMLGRVEELSK